ncbi:Cas10/Cmr2 second palm domain-containing protein [Haloechinothrix sp. LS1_15]|uniref:Cas10/Cmr2 second palm domain-containing protein n=1 Tax=Haloechinothrix sp. LS1_15 TaxID=2652248 RepID=UPI002944EE4D|nr:hypothetical protein [Haloechinothrix sp. LS1_15]MDV6011650.1 hypothetical protein [Haloechinothrix sp. LS1_15]
MATIAADGNGLGDFMRRVRDHAPTDSGDLPRRINQATWRALVDAIDAVSRPEVKQLPLVPHFIGGDDVLVSVPAHDAWRFTCRLQERFTDRLRAELGEMVGNLDPPTMSAGVVIHHRTVPIFVVVELAEALLSRSKSEWRGELAALAWHDITNEGPEPTRRGSISLDGLRTHWEELNQLRSLPASARHRLVRLAAGEADAAELDEHLDRLQLRDYVEPFLRSDQINLVDALRMVRWWLG